MGNIFYSTLRLVLQKKLQNVVNLILNGQYLLLAVLVKGNESLKVVNLILNGQYLLQILAAGNMDLVRGGRKPYSKWTISSTLS